MSWWLRELTHPVAARHPSQEGIYFRRRRISLDLSTKQNRDRSPLGRSARRARWVSHFSRLTDTGNLSEKP